MAGKGGISLEDWSGSGATKALHATIMELAGKSDKQTRTMIRLTWAIAFLTVAMLAAVGFQIYLALRAPQDSVSLSVGAEGGGFRPDATY
jgi:hypothetical protein